MYENFGENNKNQGVLAAFAQFQLKDSQLNKHNFFLENFKEGLDLVIIY